MYHIGQCVTHPMHGAGTISGMIEQRPDGHPKMYYVLTLMKGGLQLYVPCDGCEKAGLRPVITRQEADLLLQSFAALETESGGNWNQRYRDNMDRLKSGQPGQVAVVIKSLLQREAQKHLSTGERKMLNTALQILASELALVIELDLAEAEAIVRSVLK
ncbi:MAG: CarD family transcriptional regulator [Clostridia bacterium]|nr:CarD family transcriptional regulator [Clostridia bacterium]